MSPEDHNALHRAERGHAGLTAEIVWDCRVRHHRDGTTFRELADEFGVRAESVWKAVTGRTWKQVAMP